jgi:hypothetical protein
MTALGSIQQAWHVTLLLGAGLGVPLLLRWLWHRANAWGELAALVASGVAATVLLGSALAEPVRLLVVGALGAAASVATSLATRPEPEPLLARFYARVQPPGFWRTPEARRRLARCLLASAAAASSLYGMLIGLGVWLIGAPVPFAAPRSLFVAVCLLLSVAAAPFWLRELAADDAPAASSAASPRPPTP